MIEGSILTPDGWLDGRVEIAGGRIAALRGHALPSGAAPQPPYVLPGFVDLHVHGGGGGDAMAGSESLRRMLRYHASQGTVALAPTTMTAAPEAIRAALADIAAAGRDPQPGEALVLGAHLEGPFISPARLGAQPPLTLAGDAALAGSWADTCPIAVATVAPEIPGGLDVVRALASRGCRVQIGHSEASDAACDAACACGCTGFTHLFNAMSGLQHRADGVAGYALAHARHVELICDLHHVRPTAMLAARRAIPRLYAVSDATHVAGLPDGPYVFAGQPVTKRDGRIVLRDDVLAGSTSTLADAVRNLVGIGVPLAEASAMTSTRPADYLGLTDLGRIAPGARACLVRLDAALRVTATWVDGQSVAQSGFP